MTIYTYRCYASSWFDVLKLFDKLEETTEQFKWCTVIKNDPKEYVAYFACDLPLERIKEILHQVEVNYPFSDIFKMEESIQYVDKIPVLHPSWMKGD